MLIILTLISYERQYKLDLRRDLWWVELQCTVDASSHAGQDDASVSFEALRSSIDEGNDGARIQNSIVIVQERYLKKNKATKDARRYIR